MSQMDCTPEEMLQLGMMSKRRDDVVVFYGRDGHLIDNVKYLYLYAVNNDCGFKPYFFTHHKEEYKKLLALNLPVITFDHVGSKLLLEAGVTVFDDRPSIIGAPNLLAMGAKKIQLWHGIPLKIIGLPQLESSIELPPGLAEELRYDYSAIETVVSTSSWTSERLFSKAFKAEIFLDYGYPRNDVFLRSLQKTDLINADMDCYNLVRKHKKAGGKVAVYMPTFRDSGRNFIDAENNFILDLEELSRFTKEENILLLLKLHPYMWDGPFREMPGLVCYPSQMDIYPLLPLADALITDYSSIYFDFLLLDKPIIFFAYDEQSYIKNDREMFFDYRSMTPGPVTNNQKTMLDSLMAELANDGYAGERKALCQKLFSHVDSEASARICEYIKDVMLKQGKLL